MNRSHTSIQLQSKIWILVCLCDGCNGTGVHLGLGSPHNSQLWMILPLFMHSSPQPWQGHGISNATLNPRETALEQLPSHPPLGPAVEWPAHLPLFLCWQSRMARQENASSPAQGEIWHAQTPEYLRGIINWLVCLHNFLTHFLHPKVSLHCVGG